MNRWILAGVASLAVVLASCGDDASPSAAGIRPNQPASAVGVRPDGPPLGVDPLVLTDVACPPIDGYTGPVADEGVGGATGAAATIDAGDFFFSPTCVVNDVGDTITMTVTNSGGILHNVSIADQGIDVDVVPGETIEVSFELGDAPLLYICKYHRTAGMVGAVIPVS